MSRLPEEYRPVRRDAMRRRHDDRPDAAPSAIAATRLHRLPLFAAASALCLALALLVAPTLRAAGEAAPDDAVPDDAAVATFAGGCFWCMEPPFDETDGVLSTTSGYMGGELENPTYEAISAGGTGHAEVVQVVYDPARVDYATLLEVFWRNVDPLTANRQFCDAGSQYRSAIFAHDDEQLALAESTRRALETSDRFDAPVVTEIAEAATFWPAEGYHQDYYERNPIRYKLYRTACGRDKRLAEVWGDDAA